MANAARILVVDDDEFIRDLLAAALRYAGFEARAVADGLGALAAAPSFRPNLVVLDVMLPDIDGFEVCRRLRNCGDDVPVIFLTARGEPGVKVSGFAKGGDDYVTKPFSLEELVARIRAVLKRSGRSAERGGPLVYADLELDEERHRVRRGGRVVSVSPTEFKLLRYFLLNPGRVLSKQQILDHVWRYDFESDATVVETYISYLRRKLDSGGPRLLHTVRGVGYALRVDNDDPSEDG
jgi:two-component system, OmpR family, response regulator